jgi:hypothetical protein
MVGRGRHRSPADRARTLAAIEIDVLVSCDLVRAVVRRHSTSSGEHQRAPLVVPVSLVGPEASNGNDMERAVGPGLLRGLRDA